jgi:hypothetical protein
MKGKNTHTRTSPTVGNSIDFAALVSRRFKQIDSATICLICV